MGRQAKENLIKTYNLLQEQPLYCWKLSDNGDISKFIIKKYKLYGSQDSFTRNQEYRFVFDFGSGSVVTYVKPGNIDKFVSGKVYSFIDDDKRAFDIISDSISNKIICAQKSVEKYASMLMKFSGGKLRYEENNQKKLL